MVCARVSAIALRAAEPRAFAAPFLPFPFSPFFTIGSREEKRLVVTVHGILLLLPAVLQFEKPTGSSSTITTSSIAMASIAPIA